MLGFLRMNVNEAIDNLLEITSTVFLEGSQENLDVEVNAKNLKDAIENTLQARGIPFDTKLNDETRTAVGCKVYVPDCYRMGKLTFSRALYAASSVQLSHPHIFRTYPSRETALNLTIAEAIRATISVPSYFSPVKINLPEGQKSFIGGGFGANNPTRLLLEEASMVFRKHRRVAQILSLGCGLPRVLAIGPSNEVHKLLQDVAADCEAVAHELSTRPFSTSTYLRLNVDRGMEAIAMRDWDDLGAIESHAAAYVANIDISRAIERSLRHIKERTGIVDLGQLNEYVKIGWCMDKYLPCLRP